jgi:hypothetical protein
MARMYPWKTGVALAVSVAGGYAVCALLYALWPYPSAAFGDALTMGAGAGFSKGAPTHWSFAGFAYAGAILLAGAFAAGALFAWIHALLHRSDAHA